MNKVYFEGETVLLFRVSKGCQISSYPQITNFGGVVINGRVPLSKGDFSTLIVEVEPPTLDMPDVVFAKTANAKYIVVRQQLMQPKLEKSYTFNEPLRT